MMGRAGDLFGDALFREYLLGNCGERERLRLVVVGLADTTAVVGAPKGFLKFARTGGGGEFAGDCVLRFVTARLGGDDARSRLLAGGDRFLIRFFGDTERPPRRSRLGDRETDRRCFDLSFDLDA